MQFYDVRYVTETAEEDSVSVAANSPEEAVESANREVCKIYRAVNIEETGCKVEEAFLVDTIFDKDGNKYAVVLEAVLESGK